VGQRLVNYDPKRKRIIIEPVPAKTWNWESKTLASDDSCL